MRCSVMNDQKWSALGKKVESDWSPQRDRSVRAGLERRAAKRRTLNRVGAFVLALALVSGGVGTFVHLRVHARGDAALLARGSAPPAAGVDTLAVTRLSSETILEPILDHPGRGFELRAGGA